MGRGSESFPKEDKSSLYIRYPCVRLLFTSQIINGKEGNRVKWSCWKYFFTYETKLPQGIGFGMFHLWHFLWLAVVFIGTFFLLRKYRQASGKRKKSMEYVMAFSLVGLMILRALYIAVIGENFLYELPLHLCSMAGILCALHCVFRWKWLGQVLYTLCLPGTILALLFPDWSFYPAIHFISVEAFLFHMGIVVYVIFQLSSKGIVPEFRKIWQVLLFLGIVVPPVCVFDRTFHVNYMFVNWPSPGSPLEWLAGFMGNPGYLVGYGILAILCILSMNLGYFLFTRYLKKR